MSARVGERGSSGAAVRTRFAPSPTGDLHVGGAWTALASWVVARRRQGASLLRIEDLDTPRVVKGSEEALVEDLLWLGLDWDERTPRQSQRGSEYAGAVASLEARGLAYPCDCSRTDIALVARAPHLGEESVYPGTCRDKDPAREMRRSPAVRVRVPDETVSFVDGAQGAILQNLAREVGDFVLRRGDGVYAYQLAVVVDDAAGAVTDVVRGADLLGSTARQIWLARTLGLTPPAYTHVPIVTAPDGSRLEKRSPSATVRGLRAAGVAPERIIGRLAHGLGLVRDAAPMTAAEAAGRSASTEIVWRQAAWPYPNDW
ncbi:MAG: tRNA glutamyl-Q(34) synthetase GluQRS [Polyangiaceae bacterium]